MKKELLICILTQKNKNLEKIQVKVDNTYFYDFWERPKIKHILIYFNYLI